MVSQRMTADVQRRSDRFVRGSFMLRHGRYDLALRRGQRRVGAIGLRDIPVADVPKRVENLCSRAAVQPDLPLLNAIR